MQTYIIEKLLKVFELNNWTAFLRYLPYHFSQCAMERIVYGGKKTGKIVLLSKKKKKCVSALSILCFSFCRDI